MKKSPLSFIGGAISGGMSNIVGRALNNQQSSFGSIGNPFGIFNESTFSQDPSYRAADANITRASSGGSGANYSTNADPSAVYGDGLTGPNSRYADGRGPDLTRLLHDNGMVNGPQAGGLIQSKGQRDQRNQFLAKNTENAATARNFSANTQNMAGTIYGTPENMDSSITPPMAEDIDQTGMNSLYS
jgi:hypothetical protein